LKAGEWFRRVRRVMMLLLGWRYHRLSEQVSTYRAVQISGASSDDIRKHGHVLTPGRYVGAAAQEDDGEPFEERMLRLSALWREHRAEAARLDAAIEANLKELGYGG